MQNDHKHKILHFKEIVRVKVNKNIKLNSERKKLIISIYRYTLRGWGKGFSAKGLMYATGANS